MIPEAAVSFPKNQGVLIIGYIGNPVAECPDDTTPSASTLPFPTVTSLTTYILCSQLLTHHESERERV
jgi:hypothetical protein